MPSSGVRVVLVTLAVMAVVYVGVAGIMYGMQRKLMYLPVGGRMAPASVGLPDVDELRLRSEDGEDLVAWYKPALPGHPTLLFLHGNFGNLADRANRVRQLTQDGTGLLLLAYRGYSGSTGSPTEEGLAADARSAYDWLARRVDPRGIVLLGESLGSGVAVRLAGERPVAGLVLDAPYTSTADVAKLTYWWLPVDWLMKDTYRSIDRIGALNVPVLILHGTRDRVVPFAQGKRLYEAANQPKTFVEIAGGGHVASIDHAEGLAAIRSLLANVRMPGGAARTPEGTPAAPAP